MWPFQQNSRKLLTVQVSLAPLIEKPSLESQDATLPQDAARLSSPVFAARFLQP